VLLVFHTFTAVFFNIGLFPFIMTVAATVFFSPDWPRRLAAAVIPGDLPTTGPVASTRVDRWRRWGIVAGALYCVVQIALPLRHIVYPGNVLWNEEGMRWSWRVMVREKHGSVTYFVRVPGKAGDVQVNPRQYLDARQEREMAGQPDLILQLAHHIAREFAARGLGAVEVRAEALVSLNGRPAQPMIDSSVDLTRVQDGVARKSWVLPAPASPPFRSGAR
jgi:hypothetical protein